MLSYQTPHTIANTVGLIRSTSRNAVVLVEGQDDTRLYRKFMLPPPHVQVIYCEGKNALLEVMERISTIGVDGVLAVVDADYDRHTGISHSDDVVLTEHRDVEVSVILSDAFPNVCAELMGSLSAANAVALRDEAIGLAEPVGRLRFANQRDGRHLNFKALALSDYIRGGSLDLRTYVQDLSSVSRDRPGSDELIAIAQAPVLGLQPSDLVSGHDVVAILDVVAASRTSEPPHGIPIIESMLRLGYDALCFARSELARDIANWERRTGFELLREEACP